MIAAPVRVGVDARENPGPAATVGDPIPESELVNARGETYSLHALANGRRMLLVFSSAECGSCVPVLESIGRWQRSLDGGVVVRVVTSSHPAAMRRVAPEAEPFARYGGRSARIDLGVARSPAAVLLGGGQNPVVESDVVYGLVAIQGLVDRLSRSHAS